MITFILRLRDCTSGSALLEATIVFPVVLVLMVGVIDIGRAIQDYHTADKSMRSAARYLARVPADATCAWGWDRAQNLAMYGTINPEEQNGVIVSPPLILGWTDKNTLTLNRDPVCADAPGDPMTIAISADVPIPTPFITAIGMSSSVNVRVRHEERHIGG
jgi:hypothetical protein